MAILPQNHHKNTKKPLTFDTFDSIILIYTKRLGVYITTTKRVSKILKFNQVVFTRHAAERLYERLGISVSPDSQYPLPDNLVLSSIRTQYGRKTLQEHWVHIQGRFALIIDQNSRRVITVLTKEHHQIPHMLRRATEMNSCLEAA